MYIYGFFQTYVLIKISSWKSGIPAVQMRYPALPGWNFSHAITILTDTLRKLLGDNLKLSEILN